MISNLSIRSNLIEELRRPSEVADRAERANAPLARISAHDLNDLCGIYRYWTPYFDKRSMEMSVDGLPTPEQKEQWTSYLFYGDKTVSIDEEMRRTKPWIELAEALLREWGVIQSNLEAETGIEALCVVTALKECRKREPGIFPDESFRKLEDVGAQIEQFLEGQCKMDREVQRGRVKQILGLTD